MNFFYRNLTPRQLIAYGLLIPTFLTVLVCWLQWQGVTEMHNTRDLVRHTRLVQATLQSFRYLVSSAESNQRGYLLSHNDTYLVPYRQSADLASDQFKLLRNFTSDNNDQQKNLDNLAPILKEKLDFMEQTISLEKSGNHAGALQMVATDMGRQTMEKFTASVQAMEDLELKLLLQRQAIYQSRFNFNNVLAGLLMLLCIGFIFAILLLLRRLENLQSIVTLCALTEMIEYEGGAITLEEYIRRRHEALITHGKAQVEAERLLGLLGQLRPKDKAPV